MADLPAIQDYHAHVYFDADSREPAQALRDKIEATFDIEMGHWHEKEVGPHPRWSYQVKFGTDLFAELVRGVWARREELTDMIESALVDEWPLNRLEIVLRCILETGVYELLARKKVPVRVVIGEYVDLTHAFYAGAEPGMVNGVLDTLGHKLRPDEFTNFNFKVENGGRTAKVG